MENRSMSFQEFIVSSDLPVLVDFWSDRCEPCKMMEPILHSLAQDWIDRIKVIKVDTEK
ncbi:MAG: hypothetical protein GX640_05495 [Fibrobacter sp.]|nr:hypothetical protein [Fibrobacter sp.]